MDTGTEAPRTGSATDEPSQTGVSFSASDNDEDLDSSFSSDSEIAPTSPGNSSPSIQEPQLSFGIPKRSPPPLPPPRPPPPGSQPKSSHQQSIASTTGRTTILPRYPQDATTAIVRLGAATSTPKFVVRSKRKTQNDDDEDAVVLLSSKTTTTPPGTTPTTSQTSSASSGLQRTQNHPHRHPHNGSSTTTTSTARAKPTNYRKPFKKLPSGPPPTSNSAPDTPSTTVSLVGGSLSTADVPAPDTITPFTYSHCGSHSAHVSRWIYSVNSRQHSEKWQDTELHLEGHLLMFEPSTMPVSTSLSNLTISGNTNLPKDSKRFYSGDVRKMEFSEMPPSDQMTLDRLSILKVVHEVSSDVTAVYLLKFNTEKERSKWLKLLKAAKSRALGQSGSLPIQEGEDSAGNGGKNTVPMAPIDQQDMAKVIVFLRKWIVKRQSKEALIAKGIYKYERIFGSTLGLVCRQDGTEVPTFVTRCIQAIEAKGLDRVGLYRLNGNAAVIQKLRFHVDQNDKYNLLEDKWEPEVLAGALKLFFRELKEPLVPVERYDDFLAAAKEPSDVQAKTFKKLVESLPKENYQTMKAFFLHLHRVVQQSHQNQMSYHAMSVCVGPNILWPSQELDIEALGACIIACNMAVEALISLATVLFP